MSFYDIVVWSFIALVFVTGYGVGDAHRWRQTTSRRAW